MNPSTWLSRTAKNRCPGVPGDASRAAKSIKGEPRAAQT